MFLKEHISAMARVQSITETINVLVVVFIGGSVMRRWVM